MATVYKVVVTSHWINYSKEELEEILNEAIEYLDNENGNEITIEVETRE